MNGLSSKSPAVAGISIRNGPITDEMDIDQHSNKRKGRTSGVKAVTYKEESEDSDDAKPLVST